MPSIPEREPLGDTFTGVILAIEDVHLLAVTPEPGTKIIAEGSFTMRYGVRYLGKPHISIVPGLVALEYGDMLTGEAAWEFIFKRSNLHPRADVLGYRNDGIDEMIALKYLDLALPVEVLVYADPAAVVPIAKPAAVIAPPATVLPSRLQEYLPRFESVARWQESQTHVE